MMESPIEEEKDCVDKIVSSTSNIQLSSSNLDHLKHVKPPKLCICIQTHLDHIVSRTAAKLNYGKGVLFPLPRLFPVSIEVHTGERFHHLGLRVRRTREPHGGRGEQPGVEVAGEAVDEKLGIGGKTLSPSVTATVPSE